MKTIYTHEIAKRLRAAGLPEEQAEALTYVLVDLFEASEAQNGEPDTRRLIADLDRKIESLKKDHLGKINALETARALDASVWTFLIGFSVILAAYTIIVKAT